MGGVGDVLAVKLIAEIGDVRRLHNAKALIAWAGIDPPPYESGQFIGSKCKITKRGSSTLRKIGYAVLLMQTGVKGEEFYGRMKLSRNPANLVQQQAESILRGGLANINASDLKGYKNQYEEEYRAEAYKLLDEIVKMYR